jgi:hypothetical protein
MAPLVTPHVAVDEWIALIGVGFTVYGSGRAWDVGCRFLTSFTHSRRTSSDREKERERESWTVIGVRGYW